MPRGSGKRADAGVPSLVVQSALIEYGYLKQETLQVFQHMLATATLGLAIAGATASLALTDQLGPIEQAPILLLASALILMNGMAVISMSLHVTTIARWLQHIADAHVRAMLTSAAGKGETIPPDLLGGRTTSSALHSEAGGDACVALSGLSSFHCR